MANFEKRRNGKWSVRYSEQINGKQCVKRLSGFDTKKDAQKALNSYLESKEAKPIVKNTHYTFSFVFYAYLNDLRSHAKESSIWSFNNRAKLHILPYFGDKYMDEITPIMINEWLASLNYSIEYRMSLRNIVAQTYNFGARIYDIQSPMSKVTPLRDTSVKKEMQIWTPEEYAQFEKCVDEKYRLFFKLLYISGCRKGEAIALTWSDIHDNSISITKTYSRKNISGQPMITAPKTKGSVRTISMPTSFIEELRSTKTHDGYIFSTDGEIPRTESIYDSAFRKAVVTSGVKKIRIHDLRHSCVSYLISKGLPITAISKRLGHENIEMTLNTYSHMLPADDSKMAAVFENF